MRNGLFRHPGLLELLRESQRNSLTSKDPLVNQGPAISMALKQDAATEVDP